MKIQQPVRAENVFLDLEAQELGQALDEVAQRIAPIAGLETTVVVRELMEREKLGSTSVGDGFAIPHCKIHDLKEIVVSLARFREPVEFAATDEQPIRFLFVVLSPPDQPAAHLQVLSQIARVLKGPQLRASLLEAADADGIVRLLAQTAAAEGL
jgi:mannitol/fructose-specific phosphotransferase system IIA component (Ntr-type)